jgi:hypothetical protein
VFSAIFCRLKRARGRQGNVGCATERPLYARNTTVCFRIKRIFLSGDFTFLIYCVLLIEDTLSTKNSNDKNFHNISTSICMNTSYYLNTSTSTSGY